MIDNYEIIGLIAATLTTASFIPQVYKTWKTKDVSSLSLTMYLVFFTGIVLWLIYGIHLKSLAMIVSNIVTGILAIMLIVFKLVYTNNKN
ncbi:MtN3 and saliva related transmembrane protein [Lutibacter oricola]|uniref:MtN3 and saliva related transmembrane protein n=1 Tax=Lutibacter oricola TaxID=762486 RepID=A0A1H2RVN2_9FLAO|nr:SemiSWEET transporter [Lutibacter oricola]SDW23318.1 MtN3 and saliva related transmembrane protein [Lutibacter oricola]